jgi:CBS domain-containing protein
MPRSPQDPVQSLLTGPPVEVRADDTLFRVAELMVEDSIGAVVVRGTEGPIGVVSERDLVVAVAEGTDLESDRAGDLMALEVVSITADQPVSVAAAMMLDGGIRHLPVMSGDKLVGVLSIRDVLGAYAG